MSYKKNVIPGIGFNQNGINSVSVTSIPVMQLNKPSSYFIIITYFDEKGTISDFKLTINCNRYYTYLESNDAMKAETYDSLQSDCASERLKEILARLNSFPTAIKDINGGENTPKKINATLIKSIIEESSKKEKRFETKMEQNAIYKAMQFRSQLGIEGLVLRHNGQLLAMTMGSLLGGDTFDVQFEKALDQADGAYPAICWEFSRYLRAKYPHLRWLNREDDMGIEGLRKAKLAYCPDHMIEKSWACLLEAGCDY